MVDRRSFLKAAVAAPFLQQVASPRVQGRVSPRGLQLYTVRAELQKDFDGTLAKIAAIGYKEVEFAGSFNQSPEAIKTKLACSRRRRWRRTRRG